MRRIQNVKTSSKHKLRHSINLNSKERGYVFVGKNATSSCSENGIIKHTE
jgi:hypothetical protein